ncbi:glycoside hydrolase family 3 N-terminal domain-containing protein [uncultured Shimia sp.]|uniref:glycoside hydrolase family 3 N-terminal domain-containing protein n=1 Tax=uncultured Shimia sp. TaxID=573152 RepID=UPI00262DC357|nr:glycoside hydrolase family 3 N-terminal domain-containing protein [uncultured Shimia sp.]
MSRFNAAIFGCDGLRLTPEERAFFRDANPFGFILFARNIDGLEQMRSLTDELRDCVGHHAPVLIDQEGGRVQRMRPPLATQWLPPLEFVQKAHPNAERAMYLRSVITADELRQGGVDANCAPLVDVACDVTHPFLKDRCYASDPDMVARLGRAVADGHLDGGVMPVVKHIPGHGRAEVDSHLDVPRVTAPRAALEQDFAPFRALNDLSMGMTAHLIFEDIDPRPATISPVMMSLIRDEIGFDGLIMTDDISMEALSGTVPERAAAAIAAGCDAVLHCNGTLAERIAVASAIGDMGHASQARAQRVLDTAPERPALDIPALTAELETLI